MSGMLNSGLGGECKWKQTGKMDFIQPDRLYFIYQICDDAVAALPHKKADLKSQGYLATCYLQARHFQKAKGLESNLQMEDLNQVSKQIVRQNHLQRNAL